MLLQLHGRRGGLSPSRKSSSRMECQAVGETSRVAILITRASAALTLSFYRPPSLVRDKTIHPPTTPAPYTRRRIQDLVTSFSPIPRATCVAIQLEFTVGDNHVGASSLDCAQRNHSKKDRGPEGPPTKKVLAQCLRWYSVHSCPGCAIWQSPSSLVYDTGAEEEQHVLRLHEFSRDAKNHSRSMTEPRRR